MLVSPAEGQIAYPSFLSMCPSVCFLFIFLTILIWFIPGTMMVMAWGLIFEGRNAPFFVLGGAILAVGLMVYAPLYEGAFVYKYAFYASYNQGSARKQVSNLFIKKKNSVKTVVTL